MHCKRQHATSGEVLRGAARRLTATKFRATDDDQACDDNAEKKILSRNLDNVNKIWHAVALVVESSLLAAARGVRIESLGTFALDAKDRERFFMASEFVARHRLLKYDACTGGSLAGGSVNTRLNISRVAATAGSPRPAAERVLDAVLRSLRQCLASGRSVTLSFHPVAEFSCVPSTRQSRMRYLPAFRAKKKAVTAAVARARVGVGRAKSTPTPWAAVSSDKIAAAAAATAATAAKIASAGDSQKTTTPVVANSRVVVSKSSPVTGQVPERGATASSAGSRRPRSASASASKPTRIVSNRPKSSHSCGASGVLRGNIVTEAGGKKTLTAESLVDTATTQPSSAWESPRDNRPIENVGGLTTAHGSCALLGSDISGGDPRSARRARGSGHGARERKGAAAIYRCNNGPGHRREEEWLASLLRPQTLAQTGSEGLRRLTGALRLAHADVRGRDGRLSGRTLLRALRHVGVKLTSGELAEMTSVFGRQRDGRVSLQALLAAMKGAVSPTPSIEKASGLSPARVRGWREGGRWSGGSPCGIRRTRDGKVNGTPRQETSLTPPDGRNHDTLSASDAVELLPEVRVHNEPQGSREVEKRNRDGGGYQDAFLSRHGDGRPRASQYDNTTDKTLGPQVCVPATDISQLRRECWHTSGEGGSKAKASSEERAIAELATIVYSPPCSLEGLIHVLQASKVTEQPAIACAAMSARLCQLRPGLGRARAKELAAAAACRRLDEKVCLVQLHALLERRFGRNGLSSTATAAEGSIPARSVASSPAGLSCAAVERVRRNFLRGKGGLKGLRAALSKASASVEGSLTKEELRRALTTAGGPGCPPPTAKDIDDLFTLFSCQTSAGANGGRAEVATVLRSLRGDLSPARERVVRDIFRSLLKLGRSGGGVPDGVGAPDDQGDDLTFRSPRQKTGEKKTMNDAVHVEDLKNAYCGGGGNGFSQPVNDNKVPDSDRGKINSGGWFSVRLNPGDGTPRTSRSGLNGWGVGGKAANSGVTVEQFLEHYRDVSAGIDGDDVFEAFVRGSWSLHPAAHSEKNNNTIAASERGRESAAGAGGAGSKYRTGATNAGGARKREGSPAQPRTAARLDVEAKCMEGIPARVGAATSQESERRMVDDSRRCRQPTAHRARGAPGGEKSGDGSGLREDWQQRVPRRQTWYEQEQGQPEGVKGYRVERAGNGFEQQQAATAGFGVTVNPNIRQGDQRPVDTTTVRTNNLQSDVQNNASVAQNAASRVVPSTAGVMRTEKNNAPALGRGYNGGIPFDRPAAAVRVQRVFRGHTGRRRAGAEERKRESQRASDREVRMERERPHAASRRLAGRLPRPKLPSTYGF